MDLSIGDLKFRAFVPYPEIILASQQEQWASSCIRGSHMHEFSGGIDADYRSWTFHFAFLLGTERLLRVYPRFKLSEEKRTSDVKKGTCTACGGVS